jgi:hypothetical protein
MENREMFDEINALVGAVAKAMDMGEGDVISAIEQGALGMEMMTDDQGRNCIQVTHDGRTARVYQGAIFRPDDAPETEGEEDCGSGCSCGH